MPEFRTLVFRFMAMKARTGRAACGLRDPQRSRAGGPTLLRRLAIERSAAAQRAGMGPCTDARPSLQIPPVMGLFLPAHPSDRSRHDGRRAFRTRERPGDD